MNCYHAHQVLVVLDAAILPVGVLLGVAIGALGRHPGRDILGDEPLHPVVVLPGNVAELIVERLDDIR